MYHKLLQKQIERDLQEELINKLKPFLDKVNATYVHYDEDREMIERALDISSEELSSKNKRLRKELKKHKKLSSELQNLIRKLSGVSEENVDILELTERLKHEIEQGQRAMKDVIRAKNLAEHNAHLKEMFLANVSHELRTPIHGIMGLTDILYDRTGAKSDGFYLQSIKKSADGLLVLINDLLDFSKIEAGELELEHIDFEFSNLLQNIETALSYKIEEKNLFFKFTIEDRAKGVLKSDPYRISQVLLNLINNAIKVTSEGFVNTYVRVLSETDFSVRVQIEVEDTGIGIASEKIETLFDSFRQVDSSTTRKYGGTGLGLSICEKLVALLNGVLRVESEVGKGTSFTVILDLEKSTKELKEEKKELLNAEEINYLRILIVEDHPVNQILVTSMLDNWGCEYELVENGQEAVNCLKHSGDFDIVLMDIQMPVMDGVTATKEIRKLENHKVSKIPIVALTANAIKGENVRYREAGMDGYLSKPFKPVDLFRTLLKVYNQ